MEKPGDVHPTSHCGSSVAQGRRNLTHKGIKVDSSERESYTTAASGEGSPGFQPAGLALPGRLRTRKALRARLR